MKKLKEVGSVIILNAFLGYLFILFIDHILRITNSLDNFFSQAIILIIGITLFFEIVNRVTPFHEYKYTHPIRISALLSFGLVGTVMYFY